MTIQNENIAKEIALSMELPPPTPPPGDFVHDEDQINQVEQRILL